MEILCHTDFDHSTYNKYGKYIPMIRLMKIAELSVETMILLTTFVYCIDCG